MRFVNYKMEFLKQIFSNDITTENNNFSIVDVFNKKKYQVTKYYDFLYNLKDVAKFHFAEIPLNISPLIVDVDIKQAVTNDSQNENLNLYDARVVSEIIYSYVKILNDYIETIPKSYKILLLEKKPKIKNGFLKNGFHLHFINVLLTKENYKFIYSKVQEISEYSDYIDDVASKPWLIYGGTKAPDEEPYLISKGYIFDNSDESLIEEYNWKNFIINEKYNDISLNSDNIDDHIRHIMSIRNIKCFSAQNVYNMKIEEQILDCFPVYESNENTNFTLTKEKIAELVGMLNEIRADNYNDWLKICMILTNVSKQRPEEEIYFKNVFHIFSKQSSKYNEFSCDYKWESLMKSNPIHTIGLGTLFYIAKEDGVINDVQDVLYNFSLDKIPINDYDIANMVKPTIKELYITHKDYGCFKFDSTVWKEVYGWESVFKNHINEWSENYLKKITSDISRMDEEDKDKYKKIILKLERKIKNYSTLNNISKSLFDLFFDADLSNLFKQNNSYITFKNIVFDIKNWRFIPGNPKHYLKNRIEHDYIDWNEVSTEDKEFVLDFWRKLFPNRELKKYNMKNFARFLTGKNYFKQFQFWTGTGDNGKSACITLLEKLLGKMSMKIPKTMITGVIQKQGGTNPELYRLKDARIAIIDEATKNDILDPGQIKGLTGNDKLYGRDLYQKSKDINEIEIMFFPVLITNEVPIIKNPDDATWGRIRLIRFESVFTSNPEDYIQKKKTELANSNSVRTPFTDFSNVYKSDPKLDMKLSKYAPHFISYFMSILLEYSNFEEFNSEEIVPSKVVEGLEKFKQGQNILKQYLEENYVIDTSSSNILTINKLMKDYNGSRAKFLLSFEELETALNNYCKYHPEITVCNGKIKGLVKVEY